MTTTLDDTVVNALCRKWLPNQLMLMASIYSDFERDSDLRDEDLNKMKGTGPSLKKVPEGTLSDWKDSSQPQGDLLSDTLQYVTVVRSKIEDHFPSNNPFFFEYFQQYFQRDESIPVEHTDPLWNKDINPYLDELVLTSVEETVTEMLKELSPKGYAQVPEGFRQIAHAFLYDGAVIAALKDVNTHHLNYTNPFTSAFEETTRTRHFELVELPLTTSSHFWRDNEDCFRSTQRAYRDLRNEALNNALSALEQYIQKKIPEVTRKYVTETKLHTHFSSP